MSTTELQLEPVTEKIETVYNKIFWLSYIANVSLVTAVALTFRFAELVAYLGGTEQIAGTIVSIAVLGALVVRLFLGQAIDHYGTRKLWITSSLMFVASCSLFLICTQLTWMIYAARMGFAIGVAGMFTSSVVHIQKQVPAHQRTEIIGSLGSSGFIGMIVGSQLGDWIFHAFPDGPPQFLALFGGTVVLSLFYLGMVIYLTRRDGHIRPRHTFPAHQLLFRYWPGNVVLAAIMMGVGLSVTTVFLTRYATSMQMKNAIGTFFTGYAISAFICRVSTRHWSRTYGRHRMILIGLSGHALGHCLLPLVSFEWQFLIPAAACGLGHALLFPAVISKGAGAFPRQFRGSGTTLVMGFIDLGTVVSAPILGTIIDLFGFTQLFLTSATTIVAIAVIYGLTTARVPDSDVVPLADAVHAGRKKGIVSPVPQPHIDGGEPTEEIPEDAIPVPFPQIGRNV
jgi:MFS family permease